jgi:hypothetical protein
MTTPTFVPSPEQQVIAHRGGHLQAVAFTFTGRAAASLKNRITRGVSQS